MIKKLGNYVMGSWVEGSGKGSLLYNAVNGEAIATADVTSIDLNDVLAYGRKVGNPALRKMTFQERGTMLKNLALYLSKRKEKY